MEKEQEKLKEPIETDAESENDNNKNHSEQSSDINTEESKITPDEKIIELEDKIARTYAEMENQRRRFEKEKEDAFEYGGSIFAKEAL